MILEGGIESRRGDAHSMFWAQENAQFFSEAPSDSSHGTCPLRCISTGPKYRNLISGAYTSFFRAVLKYRLHFPTGAYFGAVLIRGMYPDPQKQRPEERQIPSNLFCPV